MEQHLGSLIGDLRATLRHRPGTPERARLTAVEARLEKLEHEGVIEGFDRVTWPDQVPRDRSTPTGRRFERYLDWAEDQGVTVKPPFTVETVGSGLLGRGDRVVRTPSIVVVLRADDRLVALYPHCDGDRIVTVEDGVRAIRHAAATRDDGGDGPAGEVGGSVDEANHADGSRHDDGKDRRREPPTP